ncbi:NACHT, LRR and PYD domains-containing protein 3-like [Engraulis encrasicolus]|uniref:NACHT, LRR and PYD domains-containing protein 3-like n=1 Tax=Engraulis encrasicolus TaxID=184585 RepID=UPI002FD39358
MDEPEIKEADPPPEESVQQGASDTQKLKTNKTKKDTAEHRLTPEETELRSFLKEKCQHLVEGVPHRGDARLLQDIYTDLYITEGGRGGVNEEHEVRQIDRASMFYNIYSYMSDDEEGEQSDDFEGEQSDDFEGEESDYAEGEEGSDDFEGEKGSDDRSIRCSDIFKPLHPQRGLWQHKSIRVVLTKGVAGIGKTVSVQKFILDWTKGEANQDIHFIFPLPFRELNLMKNTELSLVELIQHCFAQMKDLKLLSSSESKTLFIFDGLDECRLPLDFHSNPRCCEVTDPASVDVLLTNLINGNLLPSALVWITTRPAAAGQIPPECVDQMTEIRGFNDPQKDDYFKKRIIDENLAMRVINHLKLSRSLYIMCHIPVFAWIFATVAERTLERGEMPRTLAQMYTHFLNIQTCIKNEKYTEGKETDEEMVLKLGKLAFEQLQKGNLIFYEEDLRESGIDVTEASLYSGVCTQIFRVEAGLCHGRVFSFVHLTIQEFLAALYVFLCFCNSSRNKPHQHQPSQLSALFRAATLEDLHKTAVDLALQSKNGHLDLFLRFLLGISLESNQKLLRHLLPQTNSQPQSLEQTVQYVKHKIRHESESDGKINLFYCLNELNQHAVVERIDRKEGKLSVEVLLPGRWQTRQLRFELSEEQLGGFDLQTYIKTPEEDLTDLLSPDDVLKKLVPAVSSALLYQCSLTEKSCALIAAAARSTSCSLKWLDLTGNSIHDTGVQHLSELLKDPQCKLETLHCAAIADAARSTSCSLKSLVLSYNNIHENGVQHLSELLKDPQCKLETLQLENCYLTEKSCALIAAAARPTSCSLKCLDLTRNAICDIGVQHLSELFKDPQCKLETLHLGYCSVTEKSCAAIAAAARSTSCSLKWLDLSGNSIHDTGAQHLSELLKDPQCKLETLELQGCDLTEESCAAIAAAVRSTSCSLKRLVLNWNSIHDTGIQHLSELLKDPQCNLETLE